MTIEIWRPSDVVVHDGVRYERWGDELVFSPIAEYGGHPIRPMNTERRYRYGIVFPENMFETERPGEWRPPPRRSPWSRVRSRVARWILRVAYWIDPA